jgi:hypothetical protein
MPGKRNHSPNGNNTVATQALQETDANKIAMEAARETLSALR